MYSIPNLLTLIRIVLIPVFVLLFYLPVPHHQMLATFVFCAAAFTDWLDGFLARRLKQTTRFGAFLDPVADKLLVACALVLIAGEFSNFWITIPAMVIVCREILISALREWMAEIGQRTSVAVSFWAKAKTMFQLGAIVILLSQPPNWELPVVWGGVALMYLAVALTLWTMMAYLKAAWATLHQ